MARTSRAYQTWELAANGLRLCELTTASGKTLEFTRNSYAEAQCTISHQDTAAQLLLDALATCIPTLRVWRFVPPFTAPGSLVFNGYLAPFGESSEEESTLGLVFRSPFARYLGDGQDRGRFTAASVAFAATDAGQIAKSLLTTANTDSYAGLATTGTIEATVTRDRTYQFSNVGQAIINLTNVQSGFDFAETFMDSGTTLAEFSVHATLDSSRPNAKFEYGADTLNNVRSMTRTTQPPINVAVVLGANGLSGTATDAGSVATYGKWYVQQSASDVTEQATLDAKAQALLRPAPVKTITFVPEYALESCPQPWDDFWIGSAVPFFARRYALSENTTVRINGARVVVDENGFEATEISDPLTPEDEAGIKAALSVEVAN